MSTARTPRIALLLARFGHYGGTEHDGYRLAIAMAEKGYAVDVICARQESEAPKGVRVLRTGRFGGLKALKMLWFLIRTEQIRRKGHYDLSISFGKTWNQDIARIGGVPQQAFWRLSREAWGSPWLGAVKQVERWLQPANWLSRGIEAHMFRHSPHIVTISEVARGWILEVYPHLALPPEQSGQSLHTVYNCPDNSRFHPPTPEQRREARQAFGMREEEYALGASATNFVWKGVWQLTQALALLPENIHVHIAGGRNPKRYRKLAKELGVEHRLHFHGRVDAMQRFYHSLDMFILPSFCDTLGNVVFEAVRSGVNTIASDQAGASFFLPPQQVFSQPGNPANIAAAVLRAKTDPRQPELVNLPEGSGIPEFLDLVEQVLRTRQG